MIQYIVTQLEDNEHGVLTKIARKTKCDCWFNIRRDERTGQDIVYDLENDEPLPLRQGVADLMEALDCKENYDACDLNAAEELILGDILSCLGIRHPGSRYGYKYYKG